MYKPRIEQLKEALTKKGYPIKTGEWELNIIGIRNDNAQPNSFDDTMCVLFKDQYGDDTLITFSCTTDAGLYWLLHPMNVDGCIIMKEGHYPNAYKIGLNSQNTDLSRYFLREGLLQCCKIVIFDTN